MEDDNSELTAAIEAQVKEWSSNTNECLTISLHNGSGTTPTSFQPEFTYPIFGEEEVIFGYQDLAINLTFAAHNLKPHLSVSYGSKFKAQGEVKATNIHEALRDFLPAVAFSSVGVEEALRDENAASWKPPGEKIREYARDGETYEVWCASLADDQAKELLENMQILVPMFIEGGSMLQLEQDWTTQRWKLFLLYKITTTQPADQTQSPYNLVGYATSYRVFTFPDRQKPLQSDLDLFLPSTQSLLDFIPPPETSLPNDFAPTSMPHKVSSPLELPSRERLSQFLILPPYQHGGHGQELYNTMYTSLTSPPNIREFTVEDPNEAFDDLRDLCDLLYLRSQNADFATLRVNTTLPPSSLPATSPIPTSLIIPLTTRTKIQSETKLNARQLDRLIEMHTLSFIPAVNRSRSRITRKEKSSGEADRAYYFWRLYVKERLYQFNRDQLVQLEREERIQRLEATVDSVESGYLKCLERVEKREGESGAHGGEEGGGVVRKRLGKRKVIDEEDDLVDVEEGADQDGMGIVEERVVAVNGHHKRARVD